MRVLRPITRGLSVVVILMMAGLAAVGFYSIRKDLSNLQSISQDNILWSATQMEVELLRFQRSVAILAHERTPQALEAMRQRFDILWSRVDLMSEGRVGEMMRSYDEGHGTLEQLAALMREVDPVVEQLTPDDAAMIALLGDRFDPFQQEMRLYNLRVVRGDTAAATEVRQRMLVSAQVTGMISLGAVILAVLSLFLIMRESARQKLMAEMSRRAAAAAEATSRAKSRFLTMMSHELRNPLNGVLGPLALLGQSELGDRQVRLVAQAQQSGRAMLGMLTGLLDYSDIQDEQIALKHEPFRIQVLADQVAAVLRDRPAASAARIKVTVAPGTPDLVWGDLERLRQIFVYLCEYVLPTTRHDDLALTFRHGGGELVGEIALAQPDGETGWKLDLLMGMSEQAGEPFSTDALGPLIARGLLAAAHGMLALADGPGGTRVIRVVVPAETVVFEKIRVHLETRSAALETLYRAALRSDRVAFNPPGSTGPADIVLVDTTSIGEGSLMGGLRARHPTALFVSLGAPESPGYFDEIVEAPHDLALLRRSVLGRLAS